MSASAGIATARPARDVPVAPLLFAGSLALYVATALATGQHAYLTGEGFVGLTQRMVGLGIVALGQTLTILVGSIDLSVANLISVSAVLASFIMKGEPAMIAPAVLAVLALSAVVGLGLLRLAGRGHPAAS